MAKGGRPRKLTTQKILAAMNDCGGLVSVISHRLGVHRATVDRYISETPELQERLAVEREAFCDVAESSLMKQIREGNTTAIIFYLKTKAKHRGYIERQEVQKVHPPTIEISKDEAAYFGENIVKSQPNSQPDGKNNG